MRRDHFPAVNTQIIDHPLRPALDIRWPLSPIKNPAIALPDNRGAFASTDVQT
jgi:hypothetical protein